jgi:hypothetical protein
MKKKDIENFIHNYRERYIQLSKDRKTILGWKGIQTQLAMLNMKKHAEHDNER